mgnify:CR=1 FL=1
MLDELRLLIRLARRLPAFLREPVTLEQAENTIRESLARREESFLRLLDECVYRVQASPYRWLLRRAGITREEVRSLIRRHGLEGALNILLDAGVYLTLDEFKGRVPIRRGRDEFPCGPHACDNAAGELRVATSGSTGARRRLVVDLDYLRYESAGFLVFATAAGWQASRGALWFPVPPGSAGIKRALMAARVGLPFERWFSQVRYRPWWPDSKSWTVTTLALATARLTRRGLPRPEFVPLDSASVVARWIAEVRGAGDNCHLETSVSGGLRVVRAAREEGLDIAGAFFRVGGEPLTDARAAVFRDAGCRVVCHYAIAETGPIGLGCLDGRVSDDTHLSAGKLAIVQREGVPGVRAPRGVAPLFVTSLLPIAPKILINVELGDTAVLETRRCSCRLGELGLHLHLHHIRSYEKLTAAGMHFLGSALLRLIEEVLPARFGGGADDYQLAEVDPSGPARVQLRIHPRLGPVDEVAVRTLVLHELGRGTPADRMMAELWRQAGVLEIARRPPEASGAKILPLRFRENARAGSGSLDGQR